MLTMPPRLKRSVLDFLRLSTAVGPLLEDAMATHDTVALMTGAPRGLRLDTACGRGKLGVTVWLGARDRAKGAQVAAAFCRDGVAQVEPVALEVRKWEDHRRVAAMRAQRWARLVILVQHAGIVREGADVGVPSDCNDTSTVSEAALRATVETQVCAVMAWTQTLLPLMRRSPAGRLVTLSSILSSLTLHSAPTWPTDTSKACAYDASQPALNAFTVHPSAAL